MNKKVIFLVLCLSFLAGCGYRYEVKRGNFQVGNVIITPSVKYLLTEINSNSIKIREYEDQMLRKIKNGRFFVVTAAHGFSIGNNVGIHLNRVDEVGKLVNISVISLKHSGYLTLPP